MTTQKSLVLTLVKIFNWNDSQSSNLFELHFYSLKNSALIHSKQIKATYSGNQAYFNYSLRVNYYSDENEVKIDQKKMLIKLCHLSKLNNSMNCLAQFVLNLDNLLNKKLQFFPFGKNDKVLKIAAGQQQKIQAPVNFQVHVGNLNFIKQKEQYLTHFTNTLPNTHRNDTHKSVKSLSQQAKEIIHNRKSLKHMKNNRGDYQSQQMHYFQEQTSKNSNLVKDYQKKLSKSNSEQNLLSSKGAKIEKTKKRREQDYEQKSNKSQKHKLDLKSLEMVACQNQYYEDSEQKERKAYIQPENKIAEKKRLIRSQLY